MAKIIVKSIENFGTEKTRVDGKVSRQHYTLRVFAAANPLLGANRNEFQVHSTDGKKAFWKGADYNYMKSLVGDKEGIEGEILRLDVEPYEINGRMATSYTCLVLKGEDAGTIAARAGHKLVSSIPQLEKEEANL